MNEYKKALGKVAAFKAQQQNDIERDYITFVRLYCQTATPLEFMPSFAQWAEFNETRRNAMLDWVDKMQTLSAD